MKQLILWLWLRSPSSPFSVGQWKLWEVIKWHVGIQASLIACSVSSRARAMGGRMRFGKRASKASDFNMDLDVYSPDRYLWLQ
ncbi:hypothetical protein L596_024917 [Steinernema carpocapsae]|uniref:Uncharacterized protein n=1 Tax=Steinernema carpocapsae TaxID=34508 RepID=A0A4U5M682_STECR|nr:hypothetical protein L596_024917 [Steinernema carpocapsae]